MSRVALVVLAAGCGPSLEPGFEDTLTEQGGCADTHFFAHDVEQTTMLGFHTLGESPIAHTTPGQARTVVYDLSESSVLLTVTVGEKGALDDYVGCWTDLSVLGSILGEWAATAGTASLTVQNGEAPPDPEAAVDCGSGSLLLEDVILERESWPRDPVELPRFEFEHTGLGDTWC